MHKKSALPHQARHREAREKRHVGTTLIVGADCRDHQEKNMMRALGADHSQFPIVSCSLVCMYFLLTPESLLFQLREIHFWKMLRLFLPWRYL
ncbi:hypothetical protein COCSADRAFT_212530 [Bipolaris sorokiniana ND90Pr]|uniref:Uncharacterized protein n=1 Tax=Cochliobolus sativus (strain ND90Pr / ATCC 201652) TaxID=665912 RepID=M2TLV3_COCSN|nr:uncharacterized protein COCSADRAFT_212530 [Bipolaris sorokiniana ND90Pr]EMD69667.1 hypothetical protein COCSADRAFT_212530 [Bipolaris sorokiniana ND90Pr]